VDYNIFVLVIELPVLLGFELPSDAILVLPVIMVPKPVVKNSESPSLLLPVIMVPKPALSNEFKVWRIVKNLS
jgi:hypothetical protein